MKSKLNNTSEIISIKEINHNILKKGRNIKRQILDFAFFVFFILTIFLTFLTNISNAAVLQPTSNFYVNDNAGVLTNSTKQYIIDTNVELQKKTGAQIVVVTVKSLDGMSIEEYANELFNSWKIGDKTKENGLLLLCSYGDRMFRVEVGYGLEGRLTDGKTGRMQDEYIIPYLKQNKFDEGIKNGYNAFLKEVADEYGAKITGSEKATRKGTSDGEVITMSIMYIAFMIIIVILRLKFGGRGGPFIFFGGGRRRLFWRWPFWRLFRRRWTLWWRRKQPKFLKLKNLLKYFQFCRIYYIIYLLKIN